MHARVDALLVNLELPSTGITLMSHLKHTVLKYIKRTAPLWIASEAIGCILIPIFGPIFKLFVVLYSLNFKMACDS